MVLACTWVLLTAGSAFGQFTFPTNEVPRDLRIDIGSMQAKQDLGYGWSLAEASNGRTYRWMKALEAQLWVELEQPTDAELWLVASTQYLPYTKQVIAVYLNRRFAGEWVCAHEPGFAPYRMKIPARLLTPGRNELLLRAAYRQRVGSDGRELSACIDQILFRFH